MEYAEASAHDGTRKCLVSETQPRSQAPVLVGILSGQRKGWTRIWLWKDLEVLANTDVEGQLGTGSESVLGIKAIVRDGQRKNWVTHTLQIEGVGTRGEVSERKESIEALRESRGEKGHVGTVNVEAQLKVVPTVRPVQSLAKLPLQFPRTSGSIRGVSQQKASNRKQQGAGKFGIN